MLPFMLSTLHQGNIIIIIQNAREGKLFMMSFIANLDICSLQTLDICDKYGFIFGYLVCSVYQKNIFFHELNTVLYSTFLLHK